jgi:hypothetical protein
MCSLLNSTLRTCNPWFLVTNTLRSWRATRGLRVCVCVHFPAPLLRVSFYDVAPVCLPYYVQERGEFFDVGGLTFPRESVLREEVNVVVLPVLRRLCGAM